MSELTLALVAAALAASAAYAAYAANRKPVVEAALKLLDAALNAGKEIV